MLAKHLTAAWLIMLPLALAPSWAGTYKWVDEKGVTHYGDAIPSQYKDAGRQELNKKGVVVRTTAPTATEEQRADAEREREARKAEEQAVNEQKRRDKALLLTYTSVEEIDRKRDRDLQHVELAITNAGARIRSLEKQLKDEQARAEHLAKANRPIPERLQQDIAETEAQQKAQEALIVKKREELMTIRAKYDAYRSRFAELKGGNR
jgi:Domain of unknown function (DUF4124)